MDRPNKDGLRAVILAPTRELAFQIHREALKLCDLRSFKICLLSTLNPHSESNLSQIKGYDILISTPSRLVQSLDTKVLNLSKVEHLILDEADNLLEEESFILSVDQVLASLSPTCAKYLFSATIPAGVEELARSVMRDPIRVVIGEK